MLSELIELCISNQSSKFADGIESLEMLFSLDDEDGELLL